MLIWVLHLDTEKLNIAMIQENKSEEKNGSHTCSCLVFIHHNQQTSSLSMGYMHITKGRTFCPSRQRLSFKIPCSTTDQLWPGSMLTLQEHMNCYCVVLDSFYVTALLEQCLFFWLERMAGRRDESC